jgi:predicted metal-dependent HD superfamily phosphohydrolase
VKGTLLQRWRTLAGEDADALGEALMLAYSEPSRHYHGLGHVVWLLDEAARNVAHIRDREFVGYAIWFHDAVYDVTRPDNEHASAAWARTALAAEGELAERVGAVIEMTKNHAQGPAESDAALFLDMDIAILGAPWGAYCRYAAGIRAEHGFVADPAFAAGRGAFLEKQLALPRLFRTDLYETALGETARANMRWEAGEMARGRMVKG